MSGAKFCAENTDGSWLGTPDRESMIPLSMLIVGVIGVAAILILAGAPYYHPFVFMMILVIVFGFALILAYINRELVRGLRGQ